MRSWRRPSRNFAGYGVTNTQGGEKAHGIRRAPLRSVGISARFGAGPVGLLGRQARRLTAEIIQNNQTFKGVRMSCKAIAVGVAVAVAVIVTGSAWPLLALVVLAE